VAPHPPGRPGGSRPRTAARLRGLPPRRRCRGPARPSPGGPRRAEGLGAGRGHRRAALGAGPRQRRLPGADRLPGLALPGGRRPRRQGRQRPLGPAPPGRRRLLRGRRPGGGGRGRPARSRPHTGRSRRPPARPRARRRRPGPVPRGVRLRVASRTSTVLWMVVGVVAISTSPILIRLAAVPALALAFWRCLAGAAVLAPFARRGRAGGLARGDLALLGAAGVFLAAHFALWNASLALTSVGAATTLVSCTPLFVGIGARFLGEPPGRRTWAGIPLATVGAVVIGVSDALAGPVAGAQATGA